MRETSVAGAWLIGLEIENAAIGLHHGWDALGALLVGVMTLAGLWRRHAPQTVVAAALVLGTALVAVWSTNGVAGNVTVTPFYVLIIQHGTIAIPKSAKPERMAENINVFDFEVTAEQMTEIDQLDKGEAGRVGPNPDSYEGV